MNTSESGAPATTNNLINDDVILRQLLKELPGVKTQFQFKGWQKSFLDRYHYLLNEEGVAKASATYEEFQKLVIKLMKQILSLKEFYDKGEVRPERTSVKALSCIQELSKQIIAVTDEQVRMVPGTGQMEKEAGYTKFMMGVVLVKDNFKQHGRLVMCAESLARFHKKMAECINDRFVLETMENFGWKLQLFCDIMSDLGLYQAMTKSQELVPVPEPLIVIATELDQVKGEQALQANTPETMISTLPEMVESEADSSKSVEDKDLEIPVEEEDHDEQQLSNTLNVEDTDEEVELRLKTTPGKLSMPLKGDTAATSRPKPGRLVIEEPQPAPRPGLIESPRRRLRNLKRFYPNKSGGKRAPNPLPIKLDDDSGDDPDYSQSSSSETVMTIQTEDADYIFENRSEQTPPVKDQSLSGSRNTKSKTKPRTSSSIMKRRSPKVGRENGAADLYQIQSNIDSEDESEYSQSSSSETVMTVQTEDADHIFAENQSGRALSDATDPSSRRNEKGTRPSLSNFLALSPESKRRGKSGRASAPANDSEYTDGPQEATPALPNAGETLTDTESKTSDVSSLPQISKLGRNDSSERNESMRKLERNDSQQNGRPVEDTAQIEVAPKRQGEDSPNGDKIKAGKGDKGVNKNKERGNIAYQELPADDDPEPLHLAENDAKSEGSSNSVAQHKQKSESPPSAVSGSNQRDASMPKRKDRKDVRSKEIVDKPPDSSVEDTNNKSHDPRLADSQNGDTKSEDSANGASPLQPSKKTKGGPECQPMSPKPKATAKIPPPSPRSTRRDKKDTAEKKKSTEPIQIEQKKGRGDGEKKVLETVVVVVEDCYPVSVGGKQLDARVLQYLLTYLSSRESVFGEDVYTHNVHVVKSLEEFGKAGASTGFVATASTQGSSKEKLSTLIAKADCYIVLSSDRSHSIPLMEHFDKQCYRGKCAGIIIYSPNPWCEMRGAVSMSMLCHDLGCLPVSSFCCISDADEMLDRQRGLTEDSRRILGQLPQMLIQLEWTAVAFKKQRAGVGVPF